MSTPDHPPETAGPASAAQRAAEAEVERVFRADHGRVVASLARVLGDLELAEEAVQEAFTVALERWPVDGVPPSPTGWIVTTGRNRALDRLRREARRDDKQAQSVLLHVSDDEEVTAVTDDRLRLIFTCCHPALAPEAQVALTLRLVCGLQTSEIARAFLVPEATLAQRAVRAKKKIRAARIPYRVPERDELPARLGPVLAVVHLVLNEGYLASSGPDLQRVDLVGEAVRLARLLVALLPGEPEPVGLLALALLTSARTPARTGPGGELVRLPDQDRSLWDDALLQEGHDLVRWCLRRDEPGPYQVQAAIAAVHTDAPAAADTDWAQILALYDHLFELTPTPVVALNRAVALAEVEGPAVALLTVDTLNLSGFHLFHAVRGDLLMRLGRTEDARRELVIASQNTGNDRERLLLVARIESVP